MIVRELTLGPKRFTDLRAGLPGASPNVLSQRLRELEERGIVRRSTLPPPAASKVYKLTDWGQELEPVLEALGRWGARAPLIPDAGMSPDAHVLSLKTLFDSGLAEGFAARLDLRLGEERFFAEVADGHLTIVRGEGPEIHARVKTDHGTMLAVAHRRRELREALSSGDLAVEGDTEVVERFFDLFTLPKPVEGVEGSDPYVPA